jgi:hypothetical protein
MADLLGTFEVYRLLEIVQPRNSLLVVGSYLGDILSRMPGVRCSSALRFFIVLRDDRQRVCLLLAYQEAHLRERSGAV